MIWYLTGFLCLLQIVFWGLGLAWLVAPRRWRSFWPAFCPVLGLGLQSAVVWAGAHTALPGTDSYALASLLLPTGLLILAVTRNGGLAGAWALLSRARGWWAVGAIMVLSLSMQLVPFTKPPAVLNSITLGSCDSADYAAGARVLKEFSSRDRSGFLGDKEVVQVLSVDNFYDFWLRLNHFSPSAIIALQSTLFGRPPHELTSLLAAVFAALNLPGVFWLARAGFRFNRLAAVLVTLIYGFSPIIFYAIYQDALGQLLAAPAIALLTWVGLRVYHGLGTLRSLAAFTGLLLACNWLILGSYNFFILFAYVPLAAYVGGHTLWHRAWKRLGKWCLCMVFNLVVCALLFPGRVLSLADRLRLFEKTPFGWRIPAFEPAGWYGVFADAKLQPSPSVWAVLIGVAGLLTLLYVLLGPLRRRPRLCALAAACVVPIFIGYALLLAIQERTQDNSSYDAYKLFAVFYPGILAALCLWMPGISRAAPRLTLWGGLLAAVLIACNITGAWSFNAAIRQSLTNLDSPLVQISAVEQMPNVSSVNVCLMGYWQRMWANYFLLHKLQYFPVPTYEGRRITPLHGQWDLCDRLMTIHPFDPQDSVDLNNHYYLVKHRCRDRVQALFASGWYLPERDKNLTWSWSRGTSLVELSNPHPYPLSASVDLTLRSVDLRRVQVWLGQTQLWEGMVGPVLVPVRNLLVPLPTGVTFLRLTTPDPVSTPNGEVRTLAFALYHLQVDLLTPPTAPLPSVPP